MIVGGGKRRAAPSSERPEQELWRWASRPIMGPTPSIERAKRWAWSGTDQHVSCRATSSDLAAAEDPPSSLTRSSHAASKRWFGCLGALLPLFPWLLGRFPLRLMFLKTVNFSCLFKVLKNLGVCLFYVHAIQVICPTIFLSLLLGVQFLLCMLLPPSCHKMIAGAKNHPWCLLWVL
jgi:hypothetical protein